MNEPTTNRAVLAGDAYASGRHLSARQALYAYKAPAYDLPGIVLDALAGVSGIVLDVGCGNGRYVRRLRDERPDLTTIGLDIATGILHEVPAPVVVADAAALPLGDRATGAVLAMHMLYHVTDAEAGLAELARALREDGALVASTNAVDDKRQLDDLWSASAADVLGTPTGPPRISLSSRFPLDHAPARLRRYFTEVRVVELPGTIAVTSPEPVLAHLASYAAWAHQAGVPFQQTIQRAGERLAAVIERDGRFTISCLSGILVCSNRR